MKIAIVTETFYPSTDGVVTRLTSTVRWLLKQGHKVMVIAPDQGITDFEGATVCGIPSFRFFLYKDLKLSLPSPAVGKALRTFDPDIVHVANPAMLGVAGVWFGRRWPMIASYHTNVPQYADFYKLPWLKPILWTYLRLLHNRADINLCTSNSVLEELTARGFKNVRLWNRGVNVGIFGENHRCEEMRRLLSGGEPDKRLLLYVGRLAAEKEIERIRDVLSASDDTRLAIVGDGPHRKQLEAIFAGTRTTFTGFLHGEQLAKAYASSDVFVFPSTTETLGLVLLEAMVSGLPVIAAASGPTREQIENGKTGFLFNPAKTNDFVHTVLTALRDERLLREVGEQARQAALAYGWDGPSLQLLGFYTAALNTKTRFASRVRERDA
ncbi:glycosyltransferase family 4 protein [Paenibacillus alkalitolerans]|uniref:glycosyltransferase family 4 protein n=1 Tax=Paenibacillus alkalitolerans TaxID=2799335 RepID=UPI0018F4C57D|nr:glycosyltransferase family 1 protein [Paenibacillus alkalitolerans]